MRRSTGLFCIAFAWFFLNIQPTALALFFRTSSLIPIAEGHEPKSAIVSPKLERMLQAPDGNPIESLTVDDLGKSVFWSLDNSEIRMWSEKDGVRVFGPQKGDFKVTSISLSGDGGMLASGGLTTGVTIWNVKTQRVKASLKWKGAVGLVAISKKARYVAISNRFED